MRKKGSKYFEPQCSGTERKCDYPNCDKPGEYRAPKTKSLDSYYWFCLEHVREYNANWNYYQNMSEDEIEQEIRNDTVWQRPTFRPGDGGGFKADTMGIHDAFGIFEEDVQERKYDPKKSKEEIRAMNTMDIEYPLTLEKLKTKYKELVKKYHPDTNDGSKEAEEKFKDISIAYKVLLKTLQE